MKEVVVTGMGVVTPFGFGVDILWKALLNGENAIRHLDSRIYQGDIVKIGAPLPELDFKDSFIPEDYFEIVKNEDSNLRLFFLAVLEAIGKSGIDPRNMDDTSRIGVFIADRYNSPIQYLDDFAPLLLKAKDDKNQINEKAFFSLLRNSNQLKHYRNHNTSESINHFVSRYYNIEGPQLSIGTACASSNTAIGEAVHKIINNKLDMAIVGGAYNFDLSAMLGFSRIEALTTNPDPDTACRPFDLNRNGFVMGAGCGILVLESLESAKKRNCDIHAKVVGFGSYTDAYRSTDPDPTATAATMSIQSALKMAKVDISEIDYINAHGTSTKMNDYTETIAIKNVFGEYAKKIPVSSTKSMIGHSIMAAAAIEAIICIKSMQDNVIHPTRNYKQMDLNMDLDYVPNELREAKVGRALSNSFGFGGINTSVVFSSVY
jgi:3-oxoacyl-[acyl-carrier-protein] synthase II